MKLNPAIFRNYDIRGLAPEELDTVGAELIGKAYGTFVQNRFGKRIVVGHDNRVTSPALKDKLIFGLLSTGCDVIDIGLSLTPAVQFLTFDTNIDAGVMVTASHNPKEFNGFRFCGKDAQPVFGQDLLLLRDSIEAANFKKGAGTVTYQDLSESYVKFLQANFDLKSKIKLLLDCGNGTSSVFGFKVFSKVVEDPAAIYCNLDSDYPHGIPDPEAEVFMHTLSSHVLKGGFDLGVAFDTDGDRFGVVDERGEIHTTDKLLMLFSKYALRDNKGREVVYDVKSSYRLEETIKAFGGVPKMIRTGHPYFISAVKDGALLGAELSGHVFFGDKYFGFDDGMYASLRVLEIMEKEQKLLSQLMDEFPKSYHTDEIKIYCLDSEKKAIVEEVKENLKARYTMDKIIEIDGVRAHLHDKAWLLLRASNTNPYLSLRIEAAKKPDLEKLMEIAGSLVPQFTLDPTFPIHYS